MPYISQTEPLLVGDLTPRRRDWVDLRNDSAGDRIGQAKSLVLRYLETAPSEEFVNFKLMVEDLTKHWPFHQEDSQLFLDAVESLEAQGLILARLLGPGLQINKAARVAQRWLQKTT